MESEAEGLRSLNVIENAACLYFGVIPSSMDIFGQTPTAEPTTWYRLPGCVVHAQIENLPERHFQVSVLAGRSQWARNQCPVETILWDDKRLWNALYA